MPGHPFVDLRAGKPNSRGLNRLFVHVWIGRLQPFKKGINFLQGQTNKRNFELSSDQRQPISSGKADLPDGCTDGRGFEETS